MSNEIIINNEEEFLKSFEELMIHDKKQKSSEKVVKKLKPVIVEYLNKHNSTQFENELGSIKITQTISENFDEDKLVQWVKENHPEFIELKPVVNMEALNNYMYDHTEEISQLIPIKKVTKSRRVYLNAK